MENLNGRDLLAKLSELKILADRFGYELFGEDFEELEHFVDETEKYTNVKYTIFIHESNFVDETKELAAAFGNEFDIWPYNCIDWKQAAKELQSDYNIVEFQGETYYYA